MTLKRKRTSLATFEFGDMDKLVRLLFLFLFVLILCNLFSQKAVAYSCRQQVAKLENCLSLRLLPLLLFRFSSGAQSKSGKTAV